MGCEDKFINLFPCLFFMDGIIIYDGMPFMNLEKLAYGYPDKTHRKKLFHDVYIFHGGKPFLFARGGMVLRSQCYVDFILSKFKEGLLWAVVEEVGWHNRYWLRDKISF